MSVGEGQTRVLPPRELLRESRRGGGKEEMGGCTGMYVCDTYLRVMAMQNCGRLLYDLRPVSYDSLCLSFYHLSSSNCPFIIHSALIAHYYSPLVPLSLPLFLHFHCQTPTAFPLPTCEPITFILSSALCYSFWCANSLVLFNFQFFLFTKSVCNMRVLPFQTQNKEQR